MTNPSNRKRVVTDDDLQVLDAHIAYAKTQADRAGTEADKIGQFVGDAQVVLGELADTKADIEQSAGEADAAATQALAMQGLTKYKTVAAREAAAPANGTLAYTIETADTHERISGAWVMAGPGVLADGTISVSLARVTSKAGFLAQLAKAQAINAPLDGGGRTLTLNLAGAPLNLGATPLYDCTLILQNPPVGAYSIITEGLRPVIATGFQAPARSKILSLPGHGCQIGDRIQLESERLINSTRAYFKEGETLTVIEISGDNLTVSPSTRVLYDATFPATVYRLATRTAGLNNVTVKAQTPGAWYGWNCKNLIGSIGNNVRFEGFRTYSMTLQNVVGSLTLPQSGDAHTVSPPGLSYALTVADLCDIDIVTPMLSGGRHAITHGGTRPGISRIHGGTVIGGVNQLAFDVHGGWYSCTVNGTRIVGGAVVTGFENILNDVTIDCPYNVSAALYLLNGGAEGATVTGRVKIFKRAAAGNMASIRSTRDTDLSGDSLYGGIDLEVDILHEVSPTASGSLDKALFIESSMKRFRMRGRIERVPVAGVADFASTVRLDRIQDDFTLDIVSVKEPLGAVPQDLAGTFTASTRRVRIDWEQADIGDAGGLTTGLVVTGSALLPPLADVVINLNSDTTGAAAGNFSRIRRLMLRARTKNSARLTTNGAQKCAVSLTDVMEAHLSGDSVIDERLSNCLYGLYLGGNTRLWVDGPASIRVGNANVLNIIKLNGVSTVADRSSLRVGFSGAFTPNIFGTVNPGIVSVPAGGTATVTVTVTGAWKDELAYVSANPALPVGVTITNAVVSAADTVTVTLGNSTGGSLDVPAGNWTAYAPRWSLNTGTASPAALSVAANATATFTVSIPTAAIGDKVDVWAAAALEAGLMLNEPPRVTAAGVATVTLRNVTASPVSHTGTWTGRLTRA